MNFLGKSFTAFKNLFSPQSNRTETQRTRQSLNLQNEDGVPETPESQRPRATMSHSSPALSLLTPGQGHGGPSPKKEDQTKVDTPYPARLVPAPRAPPKRKSKEPVRCNCNSELVALLSHFLNMAVGPCSDRPEDADSARGTPKKRHRRRHRPLSEIKCFVCQSYGHYAETCRGRRRASHDDSADTLGLSDWTTLCPADLPLNP